MIIWVEFVQSKSSFEMTELCSIKGIVSVKTRQARIIPLSANVSKRSRGRLGEQKGEKRRTRMKSARALLHYPICRGLPRKPQSVLGRAATWVRCFVTCSSESSTVVRQLPCCAGKQAELSRNCLQNLLPK